jgi:secondary thiamine-phosphate synthase enzyme
MFMQIRRKTGAKSASGWSFNRTLAVWCCDRHGSPTCTVCSRPTYQAGDERPWLIDRAGVMMPEPTPVDFVPEAAVVRSSHVGQRMRSVELGIDMTSRELADLTSEVVAFCSELGDGLVNTLVRHATAGLAAIELGHGTEHDVVRLVERLAPQDAAYGNSCGKGDEGSDHLMPILLSPSLTFPVIDGRVALSSSQSIVLVDRFYGMERIVRLTFLPA